MLTHCFKPFPNDALDGRGKIRAEILAARERGVWFDIGHGMGSLDFDVARAMLAEGFLPDVISSDVHALCVEGPAYDLLVTMSKFLCMGMDLTDVLRTATRRPGGSDQPARPRQPATGRHGRRSDPGAARGSVRVRRFAGPADGRWPAPGEPWRRDRWRLVADGGGRAVSKESLAYDRGLIGRPGSTEAIDTPALVLDLDAFDANLAMMAQLARDRGIALRPHAKTHKCVSIARRQMEAGAIGQCCAKLGEAEVLADAGLGGILVTSPVRHPAKIDRLISLARRVPDLAVVMEDEANAIAIGQAAAAAGLRLGVLIDCDVGTHRFGVTSPTAAVELARAIAVQPALELRGVQGYAGHCQSTSDYAERRAQSHAALASSRARARRPAGCRLRLSDRQRQRHRNP